MKIRTLVKAACAAVIVVAASGYSSAQAVVILDTTVGSVSGPTLGNFGGIFNNDPLGQSFTLGQSVNNLSIGAHLTDVNQSSAPSFEVTFSLVSGAGVGGALLGSTSITLDDNFKGIHIEDFSFLGTLLAGTYTAVFSSVGVRGQLSITTVANALPGTDPFNAAGPFLPDDQDFAIRIAGDFVNDVVAVSEPQSLAMLGFGLAGLTLVKRRRKASPSHA